MRLNAWESVRHTNRSRFVTRLGTLASVGFHTLRITIRPWIAFLLLTVAAVLYMPQHALAVEIIYKITGTMTQGSIDITGVFFGKNVDLTNYPFTMVFTLDDTKGMKDGNQSACGNGLINSGFNTPIQKAVLTIKDRSYTMGELTPSRVISSVSTGNATAPRTHITISIHHDFTGGTNPNNGVERFGIELGLSGICTCRSWEDALAYTLNPVNDRSLGQWEIDLSSATAFRYKYAHGAFTVQKIEVTGRSTHAADTTVKLGNATADEQIGLLVSGHADNEGKNWLRRQIGPFSLPHTAIWDLGDTITLSTDTASAPNEVIAFSDNHPPTLMEKVAWSACSQEIQVSLDPPVSVPIYFWALGLTDDDKNTQLEWARNAMAKTAKIWGSEHTGVVFAPDYFNVALSTLTDKARAFVSKAGCATLPDLITAHDLPWRQTGINVYLVKKALAVGAHCARRSDNLSVGILIAPDSLFSTEPLAILAHEIGHYFGLEHPCEFKFKEVTIERTIFNGVIEHDNGCKNFAFFDKTNLMWWRTEKESQHYLTEGQTFRAQYLPDSIVNQARLRSSTVTRVCDRNTRSATCPAYCKRIWSDNTKSVTDCNE